ncbi:MAG: MEKHLA domain-containing protein [Synechococcaceae cyanobacterium]|nr:MEKHLA domain-containing protein [Synechococcaceae cyanobacterium]
MAEAGVTASPAAPWLTAEAVATASMLQRSHRLAFGRPLLAGLPADLSPLSLAQELFAAPRQVLAHDGGEDPHLIYANRAALRLWRRPWGAMVGMPSRLTAAAEQRADRALALHRARDQEALSGYGGIRIDSQGRPFRIEGARLWTLRDASGRDCGQAAAFSSWWWL